MKRISANNILKFIVLLGLVVFICYWAGFAVKEAKLKLFELGFNNASEKRTHVLKSFILDGKAQLENNDTICFSELCIGDEVSKVLNNSSFQKIYIEPTSLPPVDKVFLKSYLANSVPKNEARILSSYVKDGDGWYENDYVGDGGLMEFGFSKKLIQALPSLKFKDSLASNTKDDRLPGLLSFVLSMDGNQDRFIASQFHPSPPFKLNKEFAFIELEFVSNLSNIEKEVAKPVLRNIFFTLDLPESGTSKKEAINLKKQLVEAFKLKKVNSSEFNKDLFHAFTTKSMELHSTELKAPNGQTMKVYLLETIYCKPAKDNSSCSHAKNIRYHLQLNAGNGFKRWFWSYSLILTPNKLIQR